MQAEERSDEAASRSESIGCRSTVVSEQALNVGTFGTTHLASLTIARCARGGRKELAVDIAKPRIDAGIEQTLSFDETTGVLAIGWSARPSVNLGSSLAYKLSHTDARALVSALSAFAASKQ